MEQAVDLSGQKSLFDFPGHLYTYAQRLNFSLPRVFQPAYTYYKILFLKVKYSFSTDKV